MFTFLTRAEIAEFAEKVEKEPFKREAQKTLAYLVTSLVHGTEATDQAVAASEALFGKGDFAALDEATLESVVAELPSAKLTEDRLDLISVLTELGFAKSNSEARRILKEGGASVNGVRFRVRTPPSPRMTCCTVVLRWFAVVRRTRVRLSWSSLF